jgi:hypothetical protein
MTTPLQTLILNRLSELGDGTSPLPYRHAAARSVVDGKPLVSHATLQSIAVGKHTGNLSEDTIHGIALALDVPQSRVREAMGLPSGTPTEFRLPAKANRLTASQRRAILKVVDALLAANDPEA